MNYNPEIHHRRSIRLKDYDYSQKGAYFVTICTQNRECLFGQIENAVILLNDAGKMIEGWWLEIQNKYKTVTLDTFIVMPNHFHGIISIVGADLCVCPSADGVCPDKNNSTEKIKEGEHMGSPLHRILQWFKTLTTNEYIRNVKQQKWLPFIGRLWQRNYYEHIIRNEDELIRIREYIINNPLQWAEDENNPVNIAGADLCVCFHKKKGLRNGI